MDMLSGISLTNIKQLVDLQRGQYETWVLSCAARNLDFFRRCSGLVCTAPEGARYSVYDFEIPTDNILYQAIKETRELLSKVEIEAVPKPLLLAKLKQFYTNPAPPDPKKGPTFQILHQEFPGTIARCEQIFANDITNLPDVVGLGLAHWVAKSRMQKVVATSASSRLDPVEHIELLSSIQRQVLSGSESEHFFNFGEGLNAKQKFVERISSGILQLDKALGGGFGRGEATLGIAPQGAGKTVFATQMASYFGLQKKTGLLITTEQGHIELEQRIVSNLAQVPFNMIKDGIDKARLPPDIVGRIEEIELRLRDYVIVSKWSSDKGQSVTGSLDAEISNFVRKYRRIDWLIFDWIGGALGELSNRDMQVLRLIYKMAADHLCVMAEKYNIPVIAFAQANMAQAQNKPRVDATMIAENKQLGEKFTNGFGISAMMRPHDPNADNRGAPIFLEKQFINMWKARKSEGQLLAVRREFCYQRFAEFDKRAA